MSDPLWKQLELLVADIQRELAPDAIVEHNVKIRGRDSEQMRQIDVLVRQKVGQYEIMIAIDCKDYAEPVDVKGVEEFCGFVRDIAAHKGAMVCPKGFTPAAKKVAARNQIDLFSPVDTDPHKWQVKPSLPMTCDYRGASISFGLRVTAPVPFAMPYDFWKVNEVYDKDGGVLGTCLDTALRRWNNREYPIEPGEYEGVPTFDVEQPMMDNGYGTRVQVTLTVSLRVSRRLYFGYLPIVKIRGLKDEQTGLVVTNAFTTGMLDSNEVEKSWTPIENEKDAPMRPVMRLVGLECYEITTR